MHSRGSHFRCSARIAGADRADRCLELDTLRDHARSDVFGSAASGGSVAIAIGPAEIGVTAIDVLDQEDRAVEGVQLEILELLPEGGDVRGPFGLGEFQAHLERVDLFGRVERGGLGRRAASIRIQDTLEKVCGAMELYPSSIEGVFTGKLIAQPFAELEVLLLDVAILEHHVQ